MSSLRQIANKEIVRKKIEPERVIGSIDGAGKGPTIVVLAGLHGNEPSGVKALQNVFDILHASQASFRGHFIGIRANLNALSKRVRYIDEDMNRIWFPSIVDQIRETPHEEIESSERLEIKQLLNLLDKVISADAEEPVIVADLHSFSAEGCMFSITSKDEENVSLLSSLKVPMIFGISDTLRGTALGYYEKLGHIAFALEGGQHENDLTVYNVTAALMLMLKEAGFIGEGDIESVEEFAEHLEDHTEYLPSKVELIYQHIIEEGDQFSMRPGYKNFQSVKEGEWLANDREGKIVARCDGYIIMPLYQEQGNDGFFIVQEEG